MEPEMPETAALRDAIEGLYGAFGRYPLRPVVDGCPHCIDRSDNDALHSRPLQHLTWRELSRFGWKTMTTWGTVDDFRHFLPRMLELVAMEMEPALVPLDGHADALYHWPYDREALLGKLDYSKWQTWPHSEREAVRTYLLALWRRLLVSYPSAISVNEWLNCLLRIGEDPAPYLTAWRADERLASLHHLAGFVRSSRALTRPAHVDVVQRWLWEPRTRAVLEAAFFAQSSDPALAEELSKAVNWLTWQAPAEPKGMGG